MKKNELVPVGNGESFTRCGWIQKKRESFFLQTQRQIFLLHSKIFLQCTHCQSASAQTGSGGVLLLPQTLVIFIFTIPVTVRFFHLVVKT